MPRTIPGVEMYLDVSADGGTMLAGSMVSLPRGTTQVWPAEQPLQEIADPRIVGTRFQDANLVHPELVAHLIESAANQPANMRGWGGKKIRDADTWGLPELQLLSQRALLLCCRARKITAAHEVDRWANVMEHNDYSKPHCHYEADVAVVYFLDAGDRDPNTPTDGAFELLDPRVPFCCPSRPERPTRGILPAMEPGTMILFPAEFLHYVKPYSGRRPRITLAWNLSAGLPPADRAYDPTQVVAGRLETM